MQILLKIVHWRVLIVLVASLALMPVAAEAQRLQNRSGARPSASRASRPASRPASTRQPTRPTTRPTTQQSSRSTTRQSTTSKPKINGGQKVSTDRKINTPSNAKDALADRNKGNTNIGNKVNTGDRNLNTGDRNVNIGDRGDVNIGNRDVNINIDNSRDINVRNNRNTVVRRPVAPYRRPPYSYGGHFYFSFHPFYYHPYRPFYWGPMWHPWGFFVTTLAATAIIVSVENQQYHYDQGVYYAPSDGGYTVVQAPVGATVKVLPEETEKVVVNETTNNYYYGGAFYEKSDEGYTVVPATAGTIVPNLPEGGEEVKLGDVTYVQFGETYYQPIQVDGKDMYEIVDVRDEEG